MRQIITFICCLFSAVYIIIGYNFFKDINFEENVNNNFLNILGTAFFWGLAIWYMIDIILKEKVIIKEKEVFKYRNPNIIYIFYIEDITNEEKEILHDIFQDNCENNIFIYKDIVYKRNMDLITHCKVETYLYLQGFNNLDIDRNRILTHSIILD